MKHTSKPLVLLWEVNWDHCTPAFSMDVKTNSLPKLMMRCPLPCLLMRYIDDVVGATSLPINLLEDFINFVNKSCSGFHLHNNRRNSGISWHWTLYLWRPYHQLRLHLITPKQMQRFNSVFPIPTLTTGEGGLGHQRTLYEDTVREFPFRSYVSAIFCQDCSFFTNSNYPKTLLRLPINKL